MGVCGGKADDKEAKEVRKKLQGETANTGSGQVAAGQLVKRLTDTPDYAANSSTAVQRYYLQLPTCIAHTAYVRCTRDGCENFGTQANGGLCNACKHPTHTPTAPPAPPPGNPPAPPPGNPPVDPPPCPPIVQRVSYDRALKQHLVTKSSTAATVLKAAWKFKRRAQVARDVVALRHSGSADEVDKDGDGNISRAEWMARYGNDTGFKHYDTNNDGQIDQGEFLKLSPSYEEGPTSKENALLHQQAQMSREEKIRDGLKLLQQRCSNIEVGVKSMMDDGNCQFRALAHELYGDQQYHPYVRAKVIQHMREHPDQYSFYVDAWDRYLDTMSTDRSWGDEVTISAAAEALGCTIHIVTTEKENWLLEYGGNSSMAKDQKRQCFLAYVSPIHYNVIVPAEAPPAPPEAADQM